MSWTPQAEVPFRRDARQERERERTKCSMYFMQGLMGDGLCELESRIEVRNISEKIVKTLLHFNIDSPTDCVSTLVPVSSRSRIRPSSASATCAVFTLVRDEKDFLPIWVRYYSRHFDVGDLFILDHGTTDGSTDPSNLPPGINVIPCGEMHRTTRTFSFNRQIEKHAQRLLLEIRLQVLPLHRSGRVPRARPFSCPLKGLDSTSLTLWQTILDTRDSVRPIAWHEHDPR